MQPKRGNGGVGTSVYNLAAFPSLFQNQMFVKSCVSGPDSKVSADPDSGRQKVYPKKEKMKNIKFEEVTIGLELECPMKGFKKTYSI